jgi:nucleoside-diphosphate-sugar epimerase
LNIGSEEQVSINEMIDVISEIAGHKVKKNYQLDKPKGVRGRSSDNSQIRKKINWDTKYSLKNGLELTYKWIYDQIKNKSKSNTDKFTKSY